MSLKEITRQISLRIRSERNNKFPQLYVELCIIRIRINNIENVKLILSQYFECE